jgi:hypothetical protein
MNIPSALALLPDVLSVPPGEANDRFRFVKLQRCRTADEHEYESAVVTDSRVMIVAAWTVKNHLLTFDSLSRPALHDKSPPVFLGVAQFRSLWELCRDAAVILTAKVAPATDIANEMFVVTHGDASRPEAIFPLLPDRPGVNRFPPIDKTMSMYLRKPSAVWSVDLDCQIRFLNWLKAIGGKDLVFFVPGEPVNEGAKPRPVYFRANTLAGVYVHGFLVQNADLWNDPATADLMTAPT